MRWLLFMAIALLLPPACAAESTHQVLGLLFPGVAAQQAIGHR